MKSYKVTFLPENITVNAPEGTNLLSAANMAGIGIESPCGGRGTCGKCAVKSVSGNVSVDTEAHFSDELKEAGYIPACRSKVIGDLTVEVPSFSRLGKESVLLGGKREAAGSGKSIIPICEKLFVRLNKPDLSDCINDLDSLKGALNRNYSLNGIGISLKCLRKLPHIVRKGNWEVTVTVLTIDGIREIINVEPGKSGTPVYGAAVDIGTTTVVVNLLNLETGEVVDSTGAYNRQSIYGADVISRIVYSDENADGLESLYQAVSGTINGLLGEVLAKHGISAEDIAVMVCAGNTVMSHFFMKVPATYLRLEPYVPGATAFPPVKASEAGISINPDAYVILMPSVASYVGGDITSGVLATGIGKSKELTLFIDIGTNGELVLGSEEWLVTCSCSAGPAFEGSGISSGMRAMNGAIDKILIDRDSLDAQISTIGNYKPLGICGSGLIYSISELLDAGIIDRAGKIQGHKLSRRIRKNEDEMQFILAFAEESGSGLDIVITESDIKNLLRAKGAIFAGMATMLEMVQLDVHDIKKVYIAGGFGNYLNIRDAINIGLLPDLPAERFEYVGNSSVQGAMQVLLDKAAFKEASELAGRMTYLELSVGNKFMEEFISALFIPHTDLSLFGSVVKGIV